MHQSYLAGQEALESLLTRSENELLAPLVDKYLTHNKARDREKVRYQLSRFLDFTGADVATTRDLNSTSINAFLNALRCQRSANGDIVSGATQNRYRAAIGGFCSYLIRHDHIKKHPILHGGVGKADEGEHRIPTPMSPEEVEAYFGTIRQRFGSAEHLLFRLLITTGGDLSEVLTRIVDDCYLDREQPRIHYRRSKTRTPDRLVPVPTVFLHEVTEHIAAHGLRRHEPLFSMVSYGRAQWVHQCARGAAVRPDIRIKDLRHFAAIAWRRGGLDLETVRDYLGHASIAQTVIYNRFVPDDRYEKPGVDAAAAILFGRPTLRLERAS